MSEERVLDVTQAEMTLLVLRTALEEYSASQVDDLRILAYVEKNQAELDDTFEGALAEFAKMHPEVPAEQARELMAGVAALRESRGEDGDFDSFRGLIGEVYEFARKTSPDLDGPALSDLMRMSAFKPSSERMRTSILVNLIAGFEVHIAEIMRLIIHHDPRPVLNDKTSVRWSQVASAASLDALRDDLIEDVVDTQLRGEMSKWLGFFEDKFQTKPIVISKVVLEGNLRRHTVVHGGSRATREYIARCSDNGIDCLPQGSYLGVDANYLNRLADELFSLAFEVAVNVAMKVGMNKSSEAGFVNLGFRMLMSRRFDAVRLVCGRYVDAKFIDQTSANIVRANYLLAMKRLGRLDECARLVTDWDVSALERQYKVAKLIITDQIEEAYVAIKSMLETGELEHRFWIAWPLFEDVRNYERNLFPGAPQPD
ncbi:hypothetical protein [Demequina sp.]|uniref:hypothetical protein n=1 Tax=Demequina sp. TaxID=2050685 RepID=UPI003D11E0E2